MSNILRRNLWTVFLGLLPAFGQKKPKLASGAEILRSFDARDWAKHFVAHVKAIPGLSEDEETMTTWFANALMKGYDVARGEQDRKDNTRSWCQYAGPGRGDCEHFIGVPSSLEYPANVDEYGIPHGWCVACWRGHQLAEQCGLTEEWKQVAAKFADSYRELAHRTASA